MPSTNPTYQRVGATPITAEGQLRGASARFLLNEDDSREMMMHSSEEDLEGPVGVGGGHMPSTNSSEELISQQLDGEAVEKSLTPPPVAIRTSSSITAQEYFTVFVLCFVNLINYMDRLTIAGVLPEIQDTFNRDNSDGGLLQTVFVISYMVCAPVFGYLGDRYSRRWIMILGVALWSGTTLLGSFMNQWGWFMTFRALVGIGEASYSTIAPTIISDLFTHNQRSKMLAFFYFAIPVGSGLGYIIGSETAKAFGDWRYALRVTPLLGLVAVMLIYFCKEPERGENEGSGHMEPTSYKEDLKDLCRNRSFMYSTLGFTCVAFVTGGLSWWGPTFMHLGVKLQPGNENVELSRVSLIFGGITLISGIIGVPLGSILSQRLKKRYPRCDPLICGLGLFISFPLILGAMLLISKSSWLAFLLMFLGVLSLNCNWAIVGDILLYVVVPTRRSTAEAFQILISHMFGDAGSPYLVGLLSQAFRSGDGRLSGPPKLEYIHQMPGLNILAQVAENSTSLETTTVGTLLSMNATAIGPSITTDVPHINYTQLQDEFTSLQYALFIMCFVEVLGAALFFVTSFYVVKDKQNVDRAIHDSQQQTEINEESTESSSLSGTQ